MKVKLENVRIAFPVLERPQSVNGSEPRYSATFLYPKGGDQEAKIKSAIKQVAEEKWASKATDIMKQLVAAGKVCLQNGDSKANLAGYEGNMFTNSANREKPLMVDKARREIDGRILHSGVLVNAIVDIWAMENEYGKRINASLSAIQFVADDGVNYGGASKASADEFDLLEEGGIEDDDIAF